MEYTGRIIKAGNEEAKTGAMVFKVTIKSDDKEWVFTLFDTELIDVALENFERNVKYTVEKKGNFWNLISLEPGDPFIGSATIEGTDKEIRIIRQAMVKAVCALKAGSNCPLTEIVEAADYLVEYIVS